MLGGVVADCCCLDPVHGAQLETSMHPNIDPPRTWNAHHFQFGCLSQRDEPWFPNFASSAIVSCHMWTAFEDLLHHHQRVHIVERGDG